MKRDKSDSDISTLHYSLFYDIQLHVLRVSLSHITGLRQPHNCYVSLYLHPDKRIVKETKIVGKSSCPVFNEAFEFRSVIPGELLSRVLVATVMSREKFSRNMLGMVVVMMKTANLYGASCSAEIDTMATSTEVMKLHLLIMSNIIFVYCLIVCNIISSCYLYVTHTCSICSMEKYPLP